MNDAENMYRLNLDAEVLKFTGDVPFKSIQAAERFLQSYDDYQTYGFGRWAVVAKDDQEFLGWCGLKYSPALDECDIGFRFFKSKWNRGYATESALACIDDGFNRLHLSRIVGRAMQANIASIQVLKKIGLRYLDQFDFDGHAGVIYLIEKASNEILAVEK